MSCITVVIGASRGDPTPPPTCRPLAEAVRGYSRFSGKTLTPDGDMGPSIVSALLALTFDWETFRHIGFFTLARISLLWVAHTGNARFGTVLTSHRVLINKFQTTGPGFPKCVAASEKLQIPGGPGS